MFSLLRVIYYALRHFLFLCFLMNTENKPTEKMIR